MAENQNLGLENGQNKPNSNQNSTADRANQQEIPLGQPSSPSSFSAEKPVTEIIAPQTANITENNNEPVKSVSEENRINKVNDFLGSEQDIAVARATDNQRDNGKQADNYGQDNGEESGNSSILAKRLSILIIFVAIILIVWSVAGKKQENNPQISSSEENNIKITVENKKATGTVEVISQKEGETATGENNANNQENTVNGEKVTITAFYPNTKMSLGSTDCSLVYALQRETENKYSSIEVNTVRSLITPLSDEEMKNGWSSAIPANTFLKNISIHDRVAKVSLNSGLSQVKGACAVAAATAQIKQTLLQFPYIKSVIICIENNCDQNQILQP